MVLVLILSGDSPPHSRDHNPSGTILREGPDTTSWGCVGVRGAVVLTLRHFPPKPSDGITTELLRVLFIPFCFQSALISRVLSKELPGSQWGPG